jgi:UDP-glucose 4-epimerase
MSKVLANKQVEIWGDGSVVRDFIYVADLAELCVLSGNSNVLGVFNAGSGKGYSIKEVVSALSLVSGKKINPEYRAARFYDVPHVVLDISVAKKSFLWKPSVDLLDGMHRTWIWFSGYK